MTEITLVIGSEARTADNKISGYVKSVVVDRSTRTVTHLVVEPKGREGLARLVLLDDHVDAQDSKIRLGYTGAESRISPQQKRLWQKSSTRPSRAGHGGLATSGRRRAGRGRQQDLAGPGNIYRRDGPRSHLPPYRGGGTPRRRRPCHGRRDRATPCAMHRPQHAPSNPRARTSQRGAFLASQGSGYPLRSRVRIYRPHPSQHLRTASGGAGARGSPERVGPPGCGKAKGQDCAWP